MTRTVVTGMLLTLAGCSSSGTETVDLQQLELASGTSFGMCGGYCVTELSIDSLGLTLTETAQVVTGLQPRTRTLPLSPTDWERLAGLVDTAAIRSLAGVHGCPDCADGGAEWIQIEIADTPVRVTFEYGEELDGITPLQVEIRSLRERFPAVN